MNPFNYSDDPKESTIFFVTPYDKKTASSIILAPYKNNPFFPTHFKGENITNDKGYYLLSISNPKNSKIITIPAIPAASSTKFVMYIGGINYCIKDDSSPIITKITDPISHSINILLRLLIARWVSYLANEYPTYAINNTFGKLNIPSLSKY